MACVSDAKNDPWRLERFVAAQDRAGTYPSAVAELRAGAKASHWMWFVFPQVAGLGQSAVSREFAVSSLGEARAYLAHPVLGPRLRECARIVAGTEGRTAERIFGPVDAVKLRSSMTLFAAAADEAGGAVFREVLAKYFGGMPDEATLARLLLLTRYAQDGDHPRPARGGDADRPGGPADRRGGPPCRLRRNAGPSAHHGHRRVPHDELRDVPRLPGDQQETGPGLRPVDRAGWPQRHRPAGAQARGRRPEPRPAATGSPSSSASPATPASRSRTATPTVPRH